MDPTPFDYAELIQELGIIGGCMVAIWAFVTGRIWPQKVVEKMIEAQQEAAEKSAEIISKQICDNLAEGVSDGMEKAIARGYLKINGK